MSAQEVSNTNDSFLSRHRQFMKEIIQKWDARTDEDKLTEILDSFGKDGLVQIVMFLIGKVDRLPKYVTHYERRFLKNLKQTTIERFSSNSL